MGPTNQGFSLIWVPVPQPETEIWVTSGDHHVTWSTDKDVPQRGAMLLIEGKTKCYQWQIVDCFVAGQVC